MQERLTPEEQAFERELLGIPPAAPTIARDELLFAAGRASAPSPRPWPWQLATLAAVFIATLALTHRPQPQNIERIVHVSSPEPAPRRPPAAMNSTLHITVLKSNYLDTRNAILTRGVDAVFHESTESAASPANLPRIEGAEYLPIWQKKSLDGGRS
jgi:hypothetical protein